MIKRIITIKDAKICDSLLTKLILNESEYDKLLLKNFIVQDYFQNVIKDEKNILLGYIVDKQIIGYIFLKNIIKDENAGYLIDGLFIEENHRRKGYAKELLEYSLNLLKKENPTFIEINVLYANKVARKLYKSLGFQDFKITMRKIDN